MAGDANAISMYNWAVESNSPMIDHVTSSFYKVGNLLADIPLVTAQTLEKRGARLLGGLPVPTWTDTNAGPTSFNTQPEQYTENAYTVRDNLDVDKTYANDKNQIGGPGAMRARRLKQYIEGFTFEFNYRFIQNRHQNDGTTRYQPKCFVGIRERIDDTTKYRTNPEMKIDAGNLDLSPTGMTKATANRFIELLEQLIQYTGAGPEGTGCTLYMNDFMIRRFETALRTLEIAGWGFAKDVYNNTITKFHDATIRDVGRIAPLQDGTQTSRVITNNEKTDGTDGVLGTDVCTSIYVVHYGDDWFHGWQFDTLEALDLGLINDGVTYRQVFNYSVGLWQESTRAIGRLYGIKMS